MNRPPAGRLLKTKLFLPRLRRMAVSRPGLIRRIEAGMQQGALVLVSAPAGFGKTTVLAEWAAQSQFPVAWISLDAQDNDPVNFFTYLIAALDLIEAAGPEAKDLLESLQTLPHQTILTGLLGGLEALPHPIAIVLEDYHAIESAAIHQALTFLLEHRPAQVNLVIASRVDPPVALARLRACGQLLELRADDLRFTPAETSLFLNQVMGLEISPENIAALEARTEGWIAGLQMAALSMQGLQDISGFIRTFSGSHRFILDYLAEEVLARQPEPIQRFLLHTSILGRMNGPLCEAVMAANTADNRPLVSGQQVLEALERSNLFLVPLDNERHWYRYHHLFAELLHARLQQTAPERIAGLHLRASEWYDRNGFPVEAVQHSFAAQDYRRAAELIEQHGQERWSFSDATFLNIISKLPQDMLQTHPRLGIYQAWTLIIYGQMHAAEDLLIAMAGHMQAEQGNPEAEGIQSFIDLLLIYIAEVTRKEIHARLPSPEMLDFVPEQHLGMRNSADVIYARLLSYRQQFEAAAQLLLNAARRDRAAQGTTAIPISISLLANLRIMQGRLHEAAGLCREYLQVVNENGKWRFYTAGDLHTVLGCIFREWNDLESAGQEIGEGIRTNEPWAIPRAYVSDFTALARLQWTQGNIPAAVETVRKLEEIIRGRVIPPEQISELEALKVRLLLAHGDLVAAGEWAQARPVREPLDFRQELDQIGVARVLLAQGKPGEALGLLERLSRLAVQGKRNGRLIEILLLQATALARRPHKAQALDKLAAALALGEPEGYVRVFLDEGEPIRRLLEDFRLKIGSQPATQSLRTVDQLLAAYEPQPSAAGIGQEAGHSPQPGPQAVQSVPGLVEVLTPRELEVLQWIAAGDSNQDIAARLVVSISTVKKHTGNIFGKLGVNSRTQAIARARQLGLIPSSP
ncbi:MAG TPA: LuxR C-terminal-related transcriptional regulator [Anaerolineales bacterium]